MTRDEPIPPTFADWLLRRCLPSGTVGESIRGDLYEDYIRRPAGFQRNAWYTIHAVRLGFRYAVSNRRSERQNRRGNRFGGGLLRDLRYTARHWARRPGLALLTIATLALGIGSTTAMMSVVDRVLLRSLPYPAAHELYTIWNTYPDWQGHEVLDAFWDGIAMSYPEYVDWREGQSTFRSVAIYTTGVSTLTGIGVPARIPFGSASATLFPLLGASPVLGRNFRPEEEGNEGTRVAIVSFGFWIDRLGSDERAVGRLVTIDGEDYEVVGVLPEGFRLKGLSSSSDGVVDVWVPAGIFGDARDRGHHRYEALGRILPNILPAQAESEMGPLIWGNAYPDRRGVRVLSRQEEEIASSRGPLLLLLGAAGVLMLIACVNVAALFMAEFAGRRHELATRAAIGASRKQLIRQLLTESTVIGLLGAALGAAASVFGVSLLIRMAPPGLPLPDHIPLEWPVLMVAVVLGCGTGVVFGVGPALVAVRAGANALGTHRGASFGVGALRLQRLMIVTESGLAVVLVVVAAMLTRSLMATIAVDPGFQTENLIAISLPLTGERTQPAQVTQFTRQLVEGVRAVPGVTRVTGSSQIPFSGFGGSSSFEIEGRPTPEGAKHPEAHRRSILPGYHETLGIPVLSGRTISQADDESGARVVVVSRTLADRYWPGESSLGSIILRDNQRWEVVGVVADILHADLTEERQSTFYFPFFQQPPTQFWLVIQSALETDGLMSTVRSAIASSAPEVAIGRVERLGEFVHQSTADARYRMTLVSAFGVCSILLAAVGIFGVTARAVTARRREAGIRMALGATGQGVTNSMAFQESRAVFVGVVLGLGLALLVTRGVSPFLFGVPPHDVTSFLVAAVALLSIGGAASYLPARRIGSVEPAEVLHRM